MPPLLAALTWLAAVLPAAAAASDYQSATAAYTPYREQPAADWRAANEAVAGPGGHMGHMGHMGHGPASAGEHDGQTASPKEDAADHQHHHHPTGGRP